MGVNDEGSPRWLVLAWPPCSNTRADAAPTVDGASPMRTSVRSPISMDLDETLAPAISKPCMGMAMTRKAGNKGTIFRGVDVTTSQDTEERCEENSSRPVLEQWEAERSAYRLYRDTTDPV
jgi:hypothetical protein